VPNVSEVNGLMEEVQPTGVPCWLSIIPQNKRVSVVAIL